MADGSVRIAIAHDQPIFRVGLRRILESERRYTVVGESDADARAIALVEQHSPDLLLLECSTPHGNGFGTLRALASREPQVRTVILGAYIDRQQIVEVLRLGANGVLLESVSPELLLGCVRAVMDGQYWVDRGTTRDLVAALRHYDAADAGHCPMAHALSHREREIVAALLSGESNKNIARKLGIAEQTVKNHLHELYGRFGVSSRVGLALSIEKRDFP